MKFGDMFAVEDIYFVNKSLTWREAIKEAIHPLVNDGSVDEKYTEEIINITDELGPYYILTPEMALLHASNSDSVHKTRMTITIVEDPIYFDINKDKVKILIGLAAVDSNQHLSLIQSIGNVFSDQTLIESILNSSTREEVYEIFLGNEGG